MQAQLQPHGDKAKESLLSRVTLLWMSVPLSGWGGSQSEIEGGGRLGFQWMEPMDTLQTELVLDVPHSELLKRGKHHTTSYNADRWFDGNTMYAM